MKIKSDSNTFLKMVLLQILVGINKQTLETRVYSENMSDMNESEWYISTHLIEFIRSYVYVSWSCLDDILVSNDPSDGEKCEINQHSQYRNEFLIEMLLLERKRLRENISNIDIQIYNLKNGSDYNLEQLVSDMSAL